MNKLSKNSSVGREYGFVTDSRKMHKKANRDCSFGNDFNLQSTYNNILNKDNPLNKNKQSIKSL